MPERGAGATDVRRRVREVLGGAEGEGEGCVAVGAPGPQGGRDHDPLAAPLVEDAAEFFSGYRQASLGEHDVRREDVLARPAVAVGAHPDPVLGQPAANASPGALVG